MCASLYGRLSCFYVIGKKALSAKVDEMCKEMAS